MSNPIESQANILDQLCSLIHISAEDGYKEASCRFDRSVSDDGSVSVGQEFSYIDRDNQKKSGLLEDPDWAVMDLVLDLYKEMNAHTGGDWTAFVLTMTEDGKARINFEYPGDL
ncbi:MAG: hypothetical protein CSA45_06780 [Gammaproteobacteria bacterium]|nr:MAG: hypothetical protein CSA45_06780 [Gammaproteobacteria bacterium]